MNQQLKAGIYGLSGLCLIALLLRVDGWLWGACMLGAACALWLTLQKTERTETKEGDEQRSSTKPN